MSKNIEALFEAIDNEDIGDISNYETPSVGSNDAWKFVPKEQQYNEDYAFGLAADMMVDTDSMMASEYFQAITNLLIKDNESPDCAQKIIDAVRAITREQSRELHIDMSDVEGDEGLGMRPVSDLTIIKDIQYLFKQFITMMLAER